MAQLVAQIHYQSPKHTQIYHKKALKTVFLGVFWSKMIILFSAPKKWNRLMPIPFFVNKNPAIVSGFNKGYCR